MLLDGPAGARATLALAHGAGAPMDSPFLDSIARELASRGLRIARFEFPYMAARREDGRRRGPDRPPVLLAAWRAAVEELGGASRLVIGGKSLGGRMASLLADELGARGLVCLGYPFHPPNQPRKLRTAHLVDLQCPSLIVQGERDPFGPRAEVEAMTLSKAITFAWCPDGDHDFGPRGNSGFKRKDNLALAADAVAAFATERSIT